MKLTHSDHVSRIWDTSTGQCLRTLVHEDNPAVSSVCFSPNGRFVLAFSLDNCIRLWDYVSGSVKKTYQGHKNSDYSIGGSFGVLEDRDPETNQIITSQAFVASASEDGSIVMWDVVSKAVVQCIPRAHQGVCFWVDIHEDLMVSAGKDCTIRVWKNKAAKKTPSYASNGRPAVNGSLNGAPDVNGHSPVEAEAPHQFGHQPKQLGEEATVDADMT